MPIKLSALLFVMLCPLLPAAAAEAPPLPPPSQEMPGPAAAADSVVLAGGCFWGVQAVFQHVKGVTRAVSGYAGGTTARPTYEEVSSGFTGHAESVEVTYDPRQISYGRLLQIFFSVAHDPTQKDRQGPDSGTQYRSAIFTTSPAQRQLAETYIAELNRSHVFREPIVTQLAPLTVFTSAEEYHQDYATRRSDQPYIVYNDLPKLAALRRLFPDVYRGEPMLVGADHAQE